MPRHAFLSASSSARWSACPPSAMLNAKEKDISSPYALQGTDAHLLCEYLVEKALGYDVKDPTEDLTYYDQEMQVCAEEYRDFVIEKAEEAKEHGPVMVCVEQRLDFSRWVPDGFGTGDCVIVGDGIIHIIDYKYGVGIVVPASGEDGAGNTQLKCYALGALDTFEALYEVKTIKLSIYQPRRSHVDTFELTKEELLSWANEVLAPTAKLAYTGEGEFAAGNHCQFCKVKATCRKRAEYNMELAQYEFKKPDLLEDHEIAAILPKADNLISWAGDVKSYALEQALAGTHYDGFKVVEGRSNRKYTDETAVAKTVLDAGFDPYEKKLLGITAMTKELGRKQFQELLGDFIYKPPGKPVLVPETDKREEFKTGVNDFKQMEDEHYEKPM